MESQAAISRIGAELERNGSKAFRIVATRRAVLHNSVMEVRRRLLETIDVVL